MADPCPAPGTVAVMVLRQAYLWGGISPAFRASMGKGLSDSQAVPGGALGMEDGARRLLTWRVSAKSTMRFFRSNTRSGSEQ